MKTIMAKSHHDSSFSFSRRYFNWRKKPLGEEEEEQEQESSHFSSRYEELKDDIPEPNIVTPPSNPPKKRNLPVIAVSKLKSVLTVIKTGRSTQSSSVIGTLFGHRRGHVHFAFQEDSKRIPSFLIELATPTSVLVREMASGLVRIALECERKPLKKPGKLLQEPVWRTYCNGKKCGYALRRECGVEEWKVLKAVEIISMGAGVLPGNSENGVEEGEVMYMRARFERVVGSKDSEAFYMMNPDGSGGPELSFYLIRV